MLAVAAETLSGSGLTASEADDDEEKAQSSSDLGSVAIYVLRTTRRHSATWRAAAAPTITSSVAYKATYAGWMYRNIDTKLTLHTYIQIYIASKSWKGIRGNYTRRLDSKSRLEEV